MKLKNFRVRNYKCFDDTGLVSLSAGMNIVSGPNNAGKTALLQALELRFQGVPHRSVRSVPRKGAIPVGSSEVGFTVSISNEEFQDATANLALDFPLPSLQGKMPESLRKQISPTQPQGDPSLRSIWNWFSDQPELEFQLVRGTAQPIFRPGAVPSHGLFENAVAGQNSSSVLHLMRQIHNRGSSTFSVQVKSPPSDLGAQIAPALAALIYRFSAERFAKGTSASGVNGVLDPNAFNLPEVLHLLQSSNPDSYSDFIATVREVLPQVRWVSVVPVNPSQLRIDVWVIDKKEKRDDLAVPLDESGTGIGQVLAILYVAFQSDGSRVILIDEPQSFLHPGAARKLIEVLRRFPQHQYVISTHSAGVISAADAQQVLILDNQEGTSKIECMSTTDNLATQSFLRMLGARLSDVFGMDRVIWVEGPTEERAIPILLRRMNYLEASTSIVSIRNTGDLIGKDKEKFFEIYNNISAKASILPSAISFIFDSEDRDQAAMDEITRRSKGMAHFLPRRTFENYLLHEEAIFAAVNGIAGFSESGAVERARIAEFLRSAVKEKQFWRPFAVPDGADLGSPEIHGARLLASLFDVLSNSRVSYDKTEHSVDLFRWIMDNDAAALAELEEFLKEVLAATECAGR